MSRDWDRLVLVGFLVLLALRGWLYGAVIPFNGFPDELEHLAQVRVAQLWPEIEAGRTDPGRVAAQAVAASQAVARPFPQPARPWGVQAGLAPTPDRRSLYYRLVGGLARLAGLEDPLAAWRLGRAVSLLLALGAAALVWLAARLTFPARPEAAWLSLGLVCLLPQFGALAAAVNPDGLANLVGAAFFAYLAWLGRRGFTWSGLALGAGFLALLPLVKKTAFFTFPLLAGEALARLKARLGRPWLFRLGLVGLGLALLALLLLAATRPGPAQAFAALFGLPLKRAWGEGFDPLIFRQAGVIDLLLRELRPLDPAFWLNLKGLAAILFKSFWAYLGYLDLPLGWGWYAGATLLTGLGLVGWLRLDLASLAPDQRRSVLLFAAGAGLALAVVLLREVVFFPGALAQGRHLFPALAPLAVLWAAGYASLWPRAWGPWPGAAALLFLWLMDFQTLWGLALPWFYRVYP